MGMEPRMCQLDYAAGQTRRCPGDTCPYWADDECAVGSHWAAFADNRELMELLLDLRERLARRDPRRALRQFHPPGLA
jgi:hypothetical protein